MKEKIHGIYQIICVTNGKYYIGSTNDISHRKCQHWSALRGKHHINQHLQSAFNLYGEQKFIFLLLEVCAIDQLLIVEQKYLDEIKLHKDETFNQSFIAERPEMTPETKRKISESQIGRKRSPEYCEKLSNLWKKKYANGFISPSKGTMRSEKDKLWNSERQKGAKSHRFGKRHRQDTLIKMSQIHSKPVIQMDKITKNVIKIWPSAKSAGIAFGHVNGSSIIDVCNNKNRKSALGFKWQYA